MIKPIVTPKVHNASDVYADYAEKLLREHPEYWGKYSKQKKIRNCWIYKREGHKVVEVMSWDRWKNMVGAYFMSARRAIIDGQALNMGNYIGIIEPRRVERNHNNPKINFAATQKQPKVLGEDGILHPQQIVYFDDDDWVRIAWAKTRRIPNETCYKFISCQGDGSNKGFREEFSEANMKNPMLKLSYKFFPYIKRTRLKTTA